MTTHSNASNRKVIAVLAAVVMAMFGFGFALVPVYNVLCQITGLNGKTGRVSEESAAATAVDPDRLVTVEFITSVNSNLPWDFKAETKRVKVHPGQIGEALFYAKNNAGHAIVGQAVPSLAPAEASKYFSKTECFCFTQQTLAAGEARDMPVRFIVNPALPRDIRTVTLSYTFFESAIAAAEPDVRAAAAGDSVGREPRVN